MAENDETADLYVVPVPMEASCDAVAQASASEWTAYHS
eukprot:CAMPEP_0197428844 /NCGR_PEP_ID=MMETSP1170-20131217/42252_1 /TAXON_ID=54406 /ORGANISM="Sarcinochrysis sp, Strain CCMP770" /LENGTH=37 /DNA_ID= /DNA_START= /DNA_END= /DNA_ORIENTATION=